MNIPKTLQYTKNPEWVNKTTDNNSQVGITDYAQS